MNQNLQVRLITEIDCSDALKVYAPYVENTAFNFEYSVPTEEEFLKRIKKISEEYPWLVCLKNNQIIGYSYGSRHRDRTAYNWSAESSIYVAEKYHGKGIARILYSALFELLKLQGYYSVYASVTTPNIRSETFHKNMGFEEIGVFNKIGYKFNKWHDSKWYQMFLTEHSAEVPLTPKIMKEMQETEEFKTILTKANYQLNM